MILKQYVNGVGKKGEIVKVKPNFAYNNFILPGIAAYVTPENIEKYSRKGDEDDDEKHSSQYAQRVSHHEFINLNF